MRASTPLRALVLTTLAAFAIANTAAAADKTVGEQIDDTTITAKVKADLIGDPLTKARHIDVEVYKGRVQLNGYVDSADERSKAVQIARGVKGVVAVDNNLVLKGAERGAGAVVDDAALTAKVKSALAADSRTKAHQINVESRDSVVLLAGYVNGAADIAAATEVARSVKGVARVDNKLAVK